ncbi:MAG TPA: CocE/NonD family hydrolase [Vicinamibacterales bacterium]|nr:CocE/NonD family hydrolase [Vicinamibacterales bacterium]
MVNFRLQRAALVVALLAAALKWGVLPYVDAAAFIVRAANLTDGLPGRIAAARAHETTRVDLPPIATRHGAVAARLYRPARVSRAILLVPGVHLDGIDETRLIGMAEDLAATGYAVVTVAPPDLQQFKITPANTDIIEDAALWLAKQPELAPDGRVGMMGISFSGGLSVVAAGRPDLREHVAFVMSFGGHGDLARVMRYLCSGSMPPAPPAERLAGVVTGADSLVMRPPHDYGVTVALLTFADRVVPADQVAPLSTGIGIYLRASSLTLVDMEQATAEFAHARAYADTLPEPSRTLMTHVNNRAVDQLGPLLLPVVEKLASSPEVRSLSPELVPPPQAPVFLLHGSEDTVIPPLETLFLAAHLRTTGTVRALLSGLITHAEVDRSAAASAVWELTRFWRDLMRY